MGGAETCDEMVFEGLDCSFGQVATVKSGRCELIGDIVCGEVRFEFCGDLVVEVGEFWFESAGSEVVNDGLVCLDELFLGTAGDCSCMDGIGVIIIEDEDVFVAALGWADKFSGLVREYFACWLLKASVNIVSACWWGQCWELFDVGCCGAEGDGKDRASCFASRLNVLAESLFVSFDGGGGIDAKLGYLGNSEVGPSVEVV